MNLKTTRQAVKAWLKTNLSAALPSALARIDDALFDPTISGRNECMVRFGPVNFDELHAVQDLDLYFVVWKGDEDVWVGALAEFFDRNTTLGGAVVMADLQTIDPIRDLQRPEFMLVTVSLALTVSR